MRLLLVEDDLQIASFIMKGLKQAVFVIAHANGLQYSPSTTEAAM